MTAGDSVLQSSESDGEDQFLKHSTPKAAKFCNSSEDTIPDSEAEKMNRTETGLTITSAEFLDLNKDERENFQVQDWDALEQMTIEEEDPGMAGNEGSAALSVEAEPMRYPKRGGKDKSYRPHEEEEDKDVYEFDDSFEDKDFAPSPPKLGKVFSPSKAVVEIGFEKVRGRTAEETAVATPPVIVKARRDPHLEESVRAVGGRTPDGTMGNTYGSFNKALLTLLVHNLARSKGIDLRKEPLKPSFFKDLVSGFGDVSGSCKLAPYKSHEYIMRKWRQLFCTKKAMPGGKFQADVHLFEDQNTRSPCILCMDHPHREDPRDELLQKLSDQVSLLAILVVYSLSIYANH